MERYIFSNRARAEAVLGFLKELIGTYGCASRYDLLDQYGLIPKPIDKDFGWTNLDNALIESGVIGDEAVLVLPKAVPLK